MEGAMEEKRIAVVTGGNKGIGFEICKQLASNGVFVVLTARDVKRGTQSVENLKVSGLSNMLFHQLDVTDCASIASLADFLKTHFGKLNILVNNAGIYGVDIDPMILEAVRVNLKPHEIDEAKREAPEWIRKNALETYENAEECLKINYFGTKHVTEALMPLLQLADSASIVNVSSMFGQLRLIPNEMIKKELSAIDDLTEERLTELSNSFLMDFKEGLLVAQGWPSIGGAAYKVSKALVNAYTRILAKKYSSICINCVCPGYTKTDLNWNSGFQTVEEAAKAPVMLALLSFGSSSGLFFEQTGVTTF